jgi:hypothetical protein
MTYVRGVPEGHPLDTRIALFVTNKGCLRAYFTNVLLLGGGSGSGSDGMVIGHEEDLTTPRKSAAAGLWVQRWPLRRCRAGMSSMYIVVGHARMRGTASCRLSSCLYGYCTAGWRDSFAQQRARPDFVTVRLNRATTTIRRRRNAIVARLAAHTHTHGRARATRTHNTRARALHATRTGTGGGPTHYWRARTLYDDNGGDQTRINSENYYSNK